MPFYPYRPATGPLTPVPNRTDEFAASQAGNQAASQSANQAGSPASRQASRPASQATGSTHSGRRDARTTVGYAVVDLETTGLSPTTDTIIEIGVVLTDAAGEVERSWGTLVRPEPGPAGPREIGASHIHHLTAADLEGAPTLAQVADVLVQDLAGRVVVAHNAAFDLGFLTQALGTLGYLAPAMRVPRMCTMQWSRHFLPTHSRSLAACAEVAGIDLSHHHCAEDDAMTAAALLRRYMEVARERGEQLAWERTIRDAARFTGWRWDEAAAARQRLLLRPRILRELRVK